VVGAANLEEIVANPNSNTIKAKALEIGFDLVGVAPAKPIPQAEDALRKWNDAGRAGEMDYMRRYGERVAKLRAEFPDVRSIIVAGANYYTQDNFLGIQTGLRGSVARYAWGKDYHHILGERLSDLARWIESETDGTARCQACVDTRPILERSVAELAGLGFRGKTTMLQNRQLGPWIFLGEIVTTLELTHIREPLNPECLQKGRLGIQHIFKANPPCLIPHFGRS